MSIYNLRFKSKSGEHIHFSTVKKNRLDVKEYISCELCSKTPLRTSSYSEAYSIVARSFRDDAAKLIQKQE